MLHLLATLTTTDDVTLGHRGVGGAVGDLDGDGLPEVIVAVPDRYGCDPCAVQLHIYAGVAGGVDPAASVVSGPTWSDLDEPVVVAVIGDTDGDGTTRWAVAAGGEVWVYAGLDPAPILELSGYSTDTRAVLGADINGDGLRDLLIGSAYTPWVTYAGSVDLYLGSTGGLPSTPDQVLSDGGYDEQFGAGLSAGDVDGDGDDDLLVGEPLAYCPSTGDYDGEIFVHYGSPTGIETTATWRSDCLDHRGRFGDSTALVDVDGDGALDFIAASPEEDEVAVWHNDHGVPAASFEALSGSGDFGKWVANAGDVDGDGVDDLVVSAPSSDGGAWSVYGVTLDLTSSSTGADGAGLAQVLPAGDLDGDGYGDVLVPTADDGPAWIVPGTSGGPVDSTHSTLTGTIYDAEYGGSLAGVGDVDGDGTDDLVVAATHADAGTIDGGVAWLHLGSSTGIDPTPTLRIDGTEPHGYLGVVAGVGDLDGDGFADVMIGAPAGEFAAGTVELYRGDATGLVYAATIDGGSTRNGRVGTSIVAAGDTDGDGFADAAIGAPEGYTAGTAKLGLLYGDTSIGTPEWIEQPYEGSLVDGGWATTLAGGSDLNGDGYDDVALGEPSDYGMIWMYYGTATGVEYTYDWFTGPYGVDDFGLALAAGDFDGDGFGDVAVGAPDESGTHTYNGSVFLYRGSAGGFGSSSALELKGTNAGDELGFALSNVGDMDGDGAVDLWIGSVGADEAWLCVAGLTSCEAVAGASGERFGAAVGGGDFDGDGVVELVVGAPGAVGGAVYVYGVGAEEVDTGGVDTGVTDSGGDTGVVDTSGDTGVVDTSGDTGVVDTSGDTGVVDPDTGSTDSDTGTVDSDTGVVDSDTGTVDSDTGTTDSDTGTVDSDTGTVDSDTGTTDSDTGTTDSDTGTMDSDTAPTDSDTAPTETGPTDTNADDTGKPSDPGCAGGCAQTRPSAAWLGLLAALLLRRRAFTR